MHGGNFVARCLPVKRHGAILGMQMQCNRIGCGTTWIWNERAGEEIQDTWSTQINGWRAESCTSLESAPKKLRQNAAVALTTRRISAASLLEAAIVIEGKSGERGGEQLDLFLARAQIEVAPVSCIGFTTLAPMRVSYFLLLR